MNQSRLMKLLIILIVVMLAFSGWSSYKILTLKPGEKTTTTAGIEVVKPVNSVVDAQITDDGNLIVIYADGTSKDAGYVVGFKGDKGDDGQGLPPTQAQVALAVQEYCSSGVCDGKNPTPSQVASAVSSYCSENNCRGENGSDGSDGQNATPEQIMVAVANYCSDGRCRGEKGDRGVQGIAGENGIPVVMSCVIRDDGEYVAWKYENQADSLYKNLYEIPVLSQTDSCVDLRSA